PGTAYIGTNAFGFYAIDTVAQKEKWHFDVPDTGDTSTAPAVANGAVYCVDATNRLLYALDTTDGSKKFGVPIAAAPTGSPVVGIDDVYVATEEGVIAFDARTGAVHWRQTPATPSVQPALLAFGDLVSSTRDGHTFVIDRKTGEQRRPIALDGDI